MKKTDELIREMLNFNKINESAKDQACSCGGCHNG